MTGRDTIIHGTTAASIPSTYQEVKAENDSRNSGELTEIEIFKEVRIGAPTADSRLRWRDEGSWQSKYIIDALVV